MPHTPPSDPADMAEDLRADAAAGLARNYADYMTQLLRRPLRTIVNAQPGHAHVILPEPTD